MPLSVSAEYDSLIIVGDSGTILTSYYQSLASGIKQNELLSKQQLISIFNGFFHFSLLEPTRTSIILYDTKGRFVKTLINRMQQPGSYSISLPCDISPGVYTAYIAAGKQKLNRTVIVSR
jgi:hypothetical protein